ncbi:aspartyl/asparaginyl beta-hydroxylase isoform X2 [Euwallacea fornicatus]|uniref:aspartyl/asparaginyl beta-hydroxylase isoform X2 n=1 Tax=Euwallacea fornicatus TaxID=995702 RepID=UPI00338F89F9
MSGDVQPRKRKDKKKKKDETDAYLASNEDLNIHVHKEGGTGGNICAKIVFFFLFSALIILVGLIIKENQGLNELESIESESRYSQIFEGWIDQSVDDHDDHSPEVQESHKDDEHEEDEDDDETYSESEQNNTEDDNEEEEDQSQGIEEDDTTETEEDSSTPRSDEDSEEDTVLSAEVSEEDEGTQEVDQNSKEAEEEEESKEENDRSDQSGSLERGEIVSAESVEHEEAASEERDEKEEPKEEREAGAPDLEELKPSSGVAKKIFVGLALLTVAYNVFLRKRRPDVIEKPAKSSSSEGLEECPPDLSRRNTIIPPPTLQEVELDLPDVEIEPEEYSEDDYSDEDSHSEHRTAREEYQDLRKTYTRSLSPEGDFEVKDKHYEDDVLEDGEEHEGEELEDDFENYDQDEDEELLKRLEAKYDINVGDEGDSDREVYEHSDITNKDDYEIREDIDAAFEQLDKNAAYANKMFEALLDQYPLSPRSLYGKAKALDNLAEEQQSNDILSEALTYYLRALNTPSVPNRLYIQIADRYINRARFIGQYKKAIAVHWQLIERFPENSSVLNTLAVTYLTVNLVEEARSVLQRVLSKWPDDGFALVHYGFILKTVDNDLKASIDYLSRGLKKGAPGVVNGRFYFHLGDALARLGKNDEAVKIYEEGVEQKVFMSRYQRSLYNVDRLTAKPWWELKDLAIYEKLFLALTDNWKEIRREGLSALSDRGYFEDEAENLKDTGTWKQLELFARGQKHSKNCAKTPITCSIIQRFPYARGCRRGQTKFSVIHPGTHVWPHCGPTNCRLRVHLGLKVPPETFIRVAEEMRSWKEGDIIIFDDSFEHEVWHNGSDFRLVLIIDVWHPELTLTEKRSLSPI